MQSQAIDDIGQAAGCSQQMYTATLEANTCAECAELDGNLYDINDDSKPDIPLHPLCRCVYINVPPVPGWTPTQCRDNETGKDIGFTNYADWAARKGILSESGNDVDTRANLAIIGSEEYREKFDVFSKNKANSTLCRETRRIIRQNSGTTNESASVVDGNGNIIAKQRAGRYGGMIDLSNLEGLPDGSVVLTHNHPGSTSFSDDDIATLLSNPQIEAIIAAGHDGTVYKLSVGSGQRPEDPIYSAFRILSDKLEGDINKVVSALADHFGWNYEVK